MAKTGRGSYAVRLEGNPAHHEVQYWFDKESRLRDWKGDWLVVHDAAVARSAKTLWRHHQRALELYGFRMLDTALWVRPDNLDGGAPTMEAALRRLGLAREALVFSARQFDPASAQRMTGLWNVPGILAGYRHAHALLARSTARLARLSPAAAARETLLVGRAVIRAIVRDPLLPEAIQPGAERHAPDRRHARLPGRRAGDLGDAAAIRGGLNPAPDPAKCRSRRALAKRGRLT